METRRIANVSLPSAGLCIIAGRNEARQLLVCHCSSGRNHIVITEFAATVFTAIGGLAFMGS